MSEIFNRTLLWSGAASSSCTLSEPVTNFEYFQIAKSWQHNVNLFPTNILATRYRVDCPGVYNDASYLSNPGLFRISNDGKTLQSYTFNFFYQNGSANPRTLGSGTNTTNNLKFFMNVYGINRISGAETTAIGVPCTGAHWRPYNETVLWSASGYGYSAIPLSEPASAFERIRIKMGTSADGYSIREYTSPTGDNAWLTTNCYFGGADSTMYFTMAKNVWTSGTKVLSAANMGKGFNFGISSYNPYTGTGNTVDNHWIRRNIVEVVGINRK